MRSLAEGVETAGQLAAAAELGCTYAQGFHIARPMPAEEVLPWMTARLHRTSCRRATRAGLLARPAADPPGPAPRERHYPGQSWPLTSPSSWTN